MLTGNWCRSLLAVSFATALLVTTATEVRADEVEGEGAADPTLVVEPTRASGIEEITVTARRREEKLQQAPVSIQAFSVDDLREKQVRMLTDISDSVPNLHLTAGNNPSYTRITIRGIGNSDPIVTRDPAVGVYIDGVYMSRAISSMYAVSDIERI